jgi:hypothetical protein
MTKQLQGEVGAYQPINPRPREVARDFTGGTARTVQARQVVEGQKDMSRQCLYCGRPFDLRHAAQRFCNLRCFALYGRSKYPTSRDAITKAIRHAK